MLLHSCVAFQFETNTQSQVSLEDSKDPMFNAGLKVHLELGSYYTHKDHEGKVLVLKEKDETMCHLSHHDPLTGAETMVSVSAEDIVAKLKVTKVKGSLLMEPSTLSQLFLNVTSDMEKKGLQFTCSCWRPMRLWILMRITSKCFISQGRLPSPCMLPVTSRKMSWSCSLALIR